tara:strand:+ start:2329 stop:3228 length:900 start_codon:yes stop_codon:yes gene_type:complete
MISLFAWKIDHTLYDIVRDAVKDIGLDINIIGLDHPEAGMNLSYYNSDNPQIYDKPFFLYIEEYRTFQNEAILTHHNFRGFISHIKNTCEILWNNHKTKVFHVPLSSKDKAVDTVSKHIDSLNQRPVNLIAWSSWNDIHDNNFFNRGGSLVNQLFIDLVEHGCDVTLSLRTLKSLSAKERFPQRVSVYREYMKKEDMDNIFSNGDLFLLPSVQVHSVSLTYAMSFGMPSVVSEGWGINEFCNDINSINIKNIDKIVELCNNREELKTKRRNTFSFYSTNYSDISYPQRLQTALELGLSL